MHQLNEYYDTTIEKAPLTFDGASVFSTLEGAYQHFIRPKFSETLLERQRVVSRPHARRR